MDEWAHHQAKRDPFTPAKASRKPNGHRFAFHYPPENERILWHLLLHLRCALARDEIRAITVTVEQDGALRIYTPNPPSGFSTTDYLRPLERDPMAQHFFEAVDQWIHNESAFATLHSRRLRRSKPPRAYPDLRVQYPRPKLAFDMRGDRFEQLYIETGFDGQLVRVDFAANTPLLPKPASVQPLVMLRRPLRANEDPGYTIFARPVPSPSTTVTCYVDDCERMAVSFVGTKIVLRDYSTRVLRSAVFEYPPTADMHTLLARMAAPNTDYFIAPRIVWHNFGVHYDDDTATGADVGYVLGYFYPVQPFFPSQRSADPPWLYLFNGGGFYDETCFPSVIPVQRVQKRIFDAFNRVADEHCHRLLTHPALYRNLPQPSCVLHVYGPPARFAGNDEWLYRRIAADVYEDVLHMFDDGTLTCDAIAEYFRAAP